MTDEAAICVVVTPHFAQCLRDASTITVATVPHFDSSVKTFLVSRIACAVKVERRVSQRVRRLVEDTRHRGGHVADGLEFRDVTCTQAPSHELVGC